MINAKCLNCLCNYCSKYYCAYSKTRCHICVERDMNKTLDCDFFENKKVKPKRIKIKLLRKSHNDEILQKLDYIISNMGIPKIEYERVGTYAVMFDNFEMYRGSYNNAVAFIEKNQHEFSKELRLKQIVIDI